MNPKLTFAVSVAVATTALLTACAALSRVSFCNRANVATPAIAAPAIAPPVVVTEESIDVATTAAPAIAAEDDDLNKIRQAARDYVREVYPGSKADGVFLLPLGRGAEICWAGVDTKTNEGTRLVADVLVRRFVRRNGGIYYRAQSIGQSESQALLTATARQSAR